VEVPIPEGMQITDIDSSEEEQEIRILNLRRSLAASDFRIKQLEGEIDELNTRRETLEKARQDNIYQFGQILEKVDLAEKQMKDFFTTLEKITEIAKNTP
jgi:TolA-binding protein